MPSSLPDRGRKGGGSSSRETDNAVPPFHVTKDDRIVVIRINGVDTLFEQGDAVDIFVLASSLVSLLNAHDHRRTASPVLSSLPITPVPSPNLPSVPLPNLKTFKCLPLDPARRIPYLIEKSYDEQSHVKWDVWGPMLTRVLPATVPACVWCYPAYGMKFVGQANGYVTIYDFNPVAVRNALLASEHYPDTRRDQEDYWERRERWRKDRDPNGGDIFIHAENYPKQFLAEAVKSSLPYTKYRTDLKIDQGQYVMINEDSILLVKVCGHLFLFVYIMRLTIHDARFP